jgi:hypothetical protein
VRSPDPHRLLVLSDDDRDSGRRLVERELELDRLDAEQVGEIGLVSA